MWLLPTASVPFAGAEAYCRWRGARLPTPDEYERMARWTDGRRFAAGRDVKGSEGCQRRPSPEGIRNLNLTNQWTTIDGVAAWMGLLNSLDYQEVRPFNFTAREITAAIRWCSAYPTPTQAGLGSHSDQTDDGCWAGPDWVN
jgi:hypothetical protein